jgi:hypothetical protein
MGVPLRRYVAVLLASVGAHALALFWARADPVRPPVSAPLEMDFEVVEPPPPPPLSPAPAPLPVKRPVKKVIAATVSPSATTPAPPSSATPPPPSSAPPSSAPGESKGGAQAAPGNEEAARGPALADDAPRVDPPGTTGSFLLPSQVRDQRAPTPGRTIHPDPELEAAVAKAREKARVEGRVAGMLAAGFEGARAANGLAGPEVTAWGHALEATLNHVDGGSPVQLGVTDGNAGYKQNYARAAENYGKSGDPGFRAPGRVPDQMERLQDLQAPTLIRAAAQARAMNTSIAEAAPLFSVTLEIVQAPGGALLSAALLSQSGNGKFDDFVLASVPVALTKTAPVAPPVKKELRATWAIEGWLVKNDSVGKTITDSISFIGPVLDWLANADPATAHFEYRAKLLRANQ